MGDVKRDNNFTPGLLVEADNTEKTPTPLKADPTTKRLKVTQSALAKTTDEVMSESQGHDDVSDGNVTVTTPGTAVCLVAVSTPCKRVVVHAVSGHIVVGGSTVVFAIGSRRGRYVIKTQERECFVSNVNKLYVDAEVANTLVSFYYEN